MNYKRAYRSVLLFFFLYIPFVMSEQMVSTLGAQHILFSSEAPNSVHNIIGIDTSKNALAKAIKEFGTTEIEKGHHFYESACYKNVEYIEFETNFASSGYTISKWLKNNERCKKSEKIPRRLCNKFGVCLGDTKQSISNKFGKKFKKDDVYLRYSINTMHDDVPFTLDTIMLFKFKNNTLIKLAVSMSETN